jgi:hypothetical protein
MYVWYDNDAGTGLYLSENELIFYWAFFYSIGCRQN